MLVGKREAVLWSVIDADILYHTSPEDAMEEYLDGYEFSGGNPETPEKLRECLRDLGDVLVSGYAPMEISPQAVGTYALDNVDDQLCELMDPDGDATDWSDETKAAARAFGQAVLKDFRVWAMEPITLVKLNALAWAEKYEPQWFKPKDQTS